MYKWVIGCVFVFLTGWSRAQQPYAFQYTINDGLPSSECYFVVSDKKGYIWVATDYGISCYNGRNFHNYVKELPEPSNIFLECDPFNRVWFANMGGAIGYIENGRVKTPPCAKELHDKIQAGGIFISSLQSDDEGNIWIGTYGAIYKLLRRDGFKNIHQEHVQLPDGVRLVYNKRITSSNWVRGAVFGTSALQKKYMAKELLTMKLRLIDGKSIRNYEIPFDQSESKSMHSQVKSLRNGNVLLTHQNKLIQFDKKGSYRSYQLHRRLHALYEDHEGNVFVSCINGGGVLLFPGGKLDQTPVTLLEKNSIGSICQDSEGGYWFTSVERGLFYIPYLNVKSYRMVGGLNESIIQIKRFNERLFVVNNRKELMLLHPETKRVKITQPKWISLLAKVDLIPLKERLLYVGQHVFDTDIELNNQIPHTINQSTEAPDANGITVTDKGAYYAVMFNVLGLLKDRKWELVQRIPERCLCIEFSKTDHCLYIGSKKGVFCYKNNRLKKCFQQQFKDKEIITIKETADGSLVFGTKKDGVYILKNKRWMHLTQATGLTSDYCLDICPVNAEWVLLIVQGGVDYYRLGHPGKIYKLDESRGLFTNEVTSLEQFGDALFVGTTSGLFSIPMRNLTERRTTAKIYLREWQFNGRRSEKNECDYGDNTHRFYIDVIAYRGRRSGKIYMYRLKGLDQHPKEGNAAFIEYTNLPAGAYELQVTTRGENGKLLPYKSLVNFTVLTPFWQTWWFISLLFITAVAAVVGVIVWRIRTLNRREAKRSELLRQIAESQMVALRAQMNPHFIFNAINSIQDFVLQNETEEAYRYLSKFARLIRLVMHQSNNNFLTLEQEIDWLKIYMELEQLRFKGKFEFELIIAPELEQQMDIRIPNMLLQPHLENAIWHGIMPLRGKRPGKVTLEFQKYDETLVVSIEDNGVGRDNAPSRKEHESSGVRLVSDRLEQLGKLENMRFRQEIIDLTNGRESIGTKVMLYIDQEL